MPLSKELAKLCKACEVSENTTKWMEAQELFETSEIGLMCKDERDIDKKFLDLVTPALARIKHRVAATKLWIQCRAIVDRDADRKSGKTTIEIETPLDADDLIEVTTTWGKRHHLSLPLARLLVPNLYGRRFREVNGKPRTLTIILPEALRTQSCVDRRSAQSLAVVPNQPVVSQEVACDAIPHY